MSEDWLDYMYGNSSTLTNAVWMEKILSEEGRTIFDASVLRMRAFDKAGVDVKHIK